MSEREGPMNSDETQAEFENSRVEADQPEKPEEAVSSRDVFLDALNQELSIMEQSGMITSERAEQKREAASLIETGFTDDPKHDALMFATAGIVGEEEMIDIINTGRHNKREVTVGSPHFVESPAMIAIRTRVEQGEPLDEELWTAYSEAGLMIADAEGGSAMAKLEFRLAFAELKIKAGLLEDAWEDLEELSMTPEMEEDSQFGAKVLEAIRQITS